NIKDTPPKIAVPFPQDRERLAQLQDSIPQTKQKLEARRTAARADFDKWLIATPAKTLESTVPTEKLYIHVPLSAGDGKVAVAQIDGQPRDVSLASNVTWQAGPGGAKAIEVQGQA